MKFQRGGITIDRQVRLRGAGGVALRQRFSGNGERVIVTHAASLVATVTVLQGRVTFGGFVAPERFVLCVPQRSTVRVCFEDALVDSEGVGRFGAMAEGQPQLRTADDRATLQLLNDPGSIELQRARLALHEHLSELAPVRTAARVAGMNAETLTRAYERTYGLTPKRYVTRARLFDAAIALFTGAPIVSAALASGFNDVSRFYAQFRSVLRATPGEYVRAAEAGNRQDVS